MGGQKFEQIGKLLVLDYINMRANGKERPFVRLNNIECVWLCKVLQNNKGLFCATLNGDAHYYEVTFNGDKEEVYLDCYNKTENLSYNKEELREWGIRI